MRDPISKNKTENNGGYQHCTGFGPSYHVHGFPLYTNRTALVRLDIELGKASGLAAGTVLSLCFLKLFLTVEPSQNPAYSTNTEKIKHIQCIS